MGAYPNDRSNDPMGPITYGRDFNFFKNVAPTSISAGIFNFDADLCITFPSYTVTFMLQDGYTGSVQYSFNGTTVHGDMNNFAGTQTASLIFQNRQISKIWFTTTSGDPIVRVEAWGIR